MKIVRQHVALDGTKAETEIDLILRRQMLIAKDKDKVLQKQLVHAFEFRVI